MKAVASLKDICTIAPSKSEVNNLHLKGKEVSFLPMEDLSIGLKNVIPQKCRAIEEVAGSYTYFAEGDILLAKVTPCFENGKLGIATNLVNGIGFGSSEFIVIRPNIARVIPSYLYYRLQDGSFRKEGRTLMIGACGLKRLPKSFVANTSLYLPSLPEQQRIVDILDQEFAKIDALKANAEKSLQAAKDLFQATLKKELEPKEGWKTNTLSSIGKTATGTTPSTSHKEYYGDFIPFIKPADINIDGKGGLCYSNEGLSEEGANNGRVFQENSILMVCIGASIGKVGYALYPVSSNQQINILTPSKEYHWKFLYYCMASPDFQHKVIKEGESAKATLPIINKSKWERLTITTPNITEQVKIIAHLDGLNDKCSKLQENYQKTLTLCDDLKQSLLHKAFNGEL